MAKQIKAKIKLQITGGEATPAPPVGPALGQHGLNIVEFTQKFNQQTQAQKGMVLPVEITVFEDRTMSFKIKTPATSFLIKQAAKVEKGSGSPKKEKVGKISKAEVRRIAETKLPDLNAASVEAAERIVAGTARSMGIEVE